MIKYTRDEMFIMRRALEALQEKDRKLITIAEHLDDPRGVEIFNEEIEKANEMINRLNEEIRG